MRLYEFIQFLCEYKRDITQQKLGDKLVIAAQRDRNQTIDQVLDVLEQTDPTPNKQYVEWLCKQYIAGQFRLEDQPRIRQVLTHFKQYQPRMAIKDINRYTFHSLDDAIDEIINPDIGNEKANIANTFKVVPDSEVLYNGPHGQLAIPKTEEASKELGRGTKWCTAADNDNLFDEYNSDGPLYVWRGRNGKKFQIQFESGQVMDDKDHQVDEETLNYFRLEHPVLKKLFKSYEDKMIATDPVSVVEYAETVIKGRWPEAERVIATDPNSSFRYAYDVIEGRWPEAEKVIATDPKSAYEYAKYVIKGRWPEAEKVIATDPISAYEYAKYVIKGRWPEAEKVIASDPGWAYEYARAVIKGRWPEAEKVIATDPRSVYEYARDVIKGRWPEAERVIATDPISAMRYALYVIKGRWPEAEKVIATDPKSASSYAHGIIKGRWPEAEKVIATDRQAAYEYAAMAIKDKNPSTWGARFLAGQTN